MHTHSPHAVAWAQAGRDIPAFGTTHADYFYGPIPCARALTQEEIDEDYEKNTGKVIIEEFTKRGIQPMHVPAVICSSHGPFTWGKDAAQAVYHAVVLEEVAKMAIYTIQIDPNAAPAPQRIQDKHFLRKHGPNALSQSSTSKQHTRRRPKPVSGLGRLFYWLFLNLELSQLSFAAMCAIAAGNGALCTRAACAGQAAGRAHRRGRRAARISLPAGRLLFFRDTGRRKRS